MFRRLAPIATLMAVALVWRNVSPAAAETDLDALMRQVLVRRDDNWKKLQQYVLDEREQIDLRGPSRMPVWGERREYTWYIRDGFAVAGGACCLPTGITPTSIVCRTDAVEDCSCGQPFRHARGVAATVDRSQGR